MEYLTKKVLSQYPDIGEVTSVYNELMKQKVTNTGDDLSDGDDQLVGDDKYRPLILLIAVLYKIQEKNDDFFKSGGRNIDFEQNKKVLELFGYYWHQQHHLGKMLREGINKVGSIDEISQLVDNNKTKMINTLKVDIVAASVSELCVDNVDTAVVAAQGRSLTSHTPDFVIHVNHNHRAVVLTILGTRIFPRPNTHDIIMDMAARCAPFLDGQAHGGMVVGHSNLVRYALPSVVQTLQQHPQYCLLVTGYSLGAALAQLCLLDLKHGPSSALLPPGTRVRGLLYGCPPVYLGGHGQLEDVVMVSNHNDGITGASLKCIHDVLLKTRAIHKLNLQRRILLKMALNINNEEIDDSNLKQILENDDDSSKDVPDIKSPSRVGSLMKITKKTVSKMLTGTSQDLWDQVKLNIHLCLNPY